MWRTRTTSAMWMVSYKPQSSQRIKLSRDFVQMIRVCESRSGIRTPKARQLVHVWHIASSSWKPDTHFCPLVRSTVGIGTILVNLGTITMGPARNHRMKSSQTDSRHLPEPEHECLYFQTREIPQQKLTTLVPWILRVSNANFPQMSFKPVLSLPDPPPLAKILWK